MGCRQPRPARFRASHALIACASDWFCAFRDDGNIGPQRQQRVDFAVQSHVAVPCDETHPPSHIRLASSFIPANAKNAASVP